MAPGVLWCGAARVVRGGLYCRLMGGGAARWTVAEIKAHLEKALTQYRDQERTGGDMTEAGQELADAVWRAIGPPPPRPCGQPRKVVLEERARQKRLEELADAGLIDLATGEEIAARTDDL